MATKEAKLSFTCPKTINVGKHEKLKDMIKVIIDKFLGEQEDATLLEYIVTMLDNNKSLKDIALELEPFFETANFSFALNLYDIIFEILQQKEEEEERRINSSSSLNQYSSYNESLKSEREEKQNLELFHSSSRVSKRYDSIKKSSIEYRIGNKRNIRGERDKNIDKSRRHHTLNSDKVDYRDKEYDSNNNKRKRRKDATSNTISYDNDNNNDSNSNNQSITDPVFIMEKFQDNVRRMMEMGKQMGFIHNQEVNSSMNVLSHRGRRRYPTIRGGRTSYIGRGSSRGSSRARNCYYNNDTFRSYDNSFTYNNHNSSNSEVKNDESPSDVVVTNLTNINDRNTQGPAIYGIEYAVDEFPAIRGGRGRGRGKGRGRGRRTFQNTTYVRSADIDSALSTSR